MKNTFLLLILLTIFLACGKTDEMTNACISSCNASTPGKVNLAIENHTALDIKNLTLTINGTSTPFSLFPKSNQGSYSCWMGYTEIESISFIEFNIGNNAVHQESLNYENLPREKEFAIDIRSEVDGAIRIQLVEAPDCVSDVN